MRVSSTTWASTIRCPGIDVRFRLSENVTTLAADVEEFHAGFSASLLRLEKHSFGVLATRAGLCRSRERWIGANILGDTGGLTGRGVEDVAEDAGRLGVLGVLASSAGKLKLVSILVLLGIKHV